VRNKSSEHAEHVDGEDLVAADPHILALLATRDGQADVALQLYAEAAGTRHSTLAPLVEDCWGPDEVGGGGRGGWRGGRGEALETGIRGRWRSAGGGRRLGTWEAEGTKTSGLSGLRNLGRPGSRAGPGGGVWPPGASQAPAGGWPPYRPRRPRRGLGRPAWLALRPRRGLGGLAPAETPAGACRPGARAGPGGGVGRRAARAEAPVGAWPPWRSWSPGGGLSVAVVLRPRRGLGGPAPAETPAGACRPGARAGPGGGLAVRRRGGPGGGLAALALACC
jgi:hypothetical protein